MLAFLFVIGGCKKDSSNEEATKAIIPYTTKVVGSEEYGNIILVDSAKVVFNGNSSLPASIQVGDILVSGISALAPEGFLRKVISVQQVNGQYIFVTAQASLTEAIQQGTISYHQDITSSDVVDVDSLGRNSASAISTSINKLLYDQDNNPTTTYDQIRISGNVVITPNLDIDIDIKNAQLNKFLLGFTINNSSSLSISAGTGMGTSVNFELIKYKLRPVTFSIGIVPIVLVPTIYLSVGSEGQITASVSAGVGYTSVATAGLKYENGAWENLHNFSNSFTNQPPTFSTAANVKAYLKPGLKIRLYDAKNITSSVGIEGSLKFNVNPATNPIWELHGGVEGNANLSMRIFDMTLADVSATVFTWDTLLARGSNGAIVLPIVNTVGTSSITQTSAQVSSSITSDGGSSIVKRGVCWSQIPNPSLVNCSYTTDGTGSGNFTSALVGLNANTTYYVKSYAINTAGVGYSNQVSFSTPASSASIPVVLTKTITQLSANSYSGGGLVISDGGASINARGLCWGTNLNPTIADNTTMDGVGLGVFSSALSGLLSNVTYYVRAYASNSAGTGYGVQYIILVSSPSNGALMDIDGNVYDTVGIGNQFWMKQNLRTTHFQNGDPIVEIEDSASWYLNNGSTPTWCYYKGDAVYNSSFGKLYNWYTVVDPRNMCPAGWHVPSDSDWVHLTDYLGGKVIAGAHLRSLSFWRYNSASLTDNSSGFSGYPSGYRWVDGGSYYMGDEAFWWSTSTYFGGDASYHWTPYTANFLQQDYGFKKCGYAVRCIKN